MSHARCGELCPIIHKGDEGPTYCGRERGHDGEHASVYSASHVPDSERRWPPKPSDGGPFYFDQLRGVWVAAAREVNETP